MEKPDTSPPLVPEESEQGMFSLASLFAALRRYWWLIGLCAAAGGALAWYISGSQKYVYQKKASVMLKDAKQQDAASTRILTELGVDSGAANLANESIILKSTSLMQSVVESLTLNTSYWAQQGFREIELYDESPLLASFSGLPEQRGCEVSITPNGESGYTLCYENSAREEVTLEGRYGEALQLPFAEITIRPTTRMDESWTGRSVIIRQAPVLNVTRELLAALTVTRPDEKDASLLEMTLTAHNPRKAADVLNQLIEAYNRQSLAERRESSRKTQEFITTRVAELGRQLSEVDEQIADSSKASDGVVIDTATALSADFDAAQAVEKEIFELQTQIKLAETLAAQLEATATKDGLISIDTGLADDSISSKIEAYNEAYLEYRKVSVSAGSKNPIVVTLRDRMSSTLKAAGTALGNYRNNQQIQLAALEEKKAALVARRAETASRSQALTPVLREHKVKEELYMLLLAKEQENALALYIAEPSARALETAYGSDAPISPNTTLYTAAGAAGGAALCLLGIIAIGMLNNKVRTKHDVENNCRIPVVGELPGLTRKEKRGGIFVRGSHSTMAEHLHILRNNVDHLLPRKDVGGPLILITSTMPDEGKTLITANLAAAYAQAGRRLLVIDGDLRKGSLSRELGGKGRRGLSSLLLRHVESAASVIHPLENLPECSGSVDLMAAGPLPPNPVTLLSQPQLSEVLAELCRQYDAVILDAPPYGILADTDILAQQADLSLYIIRSERIDKRHLAQVQKLADSGKLPTPAFVINDVDFKASSYNYYGYSYGYYRYGYGSKGKKSTQDPGPTPGTTSDKA